MDVPFWVWGAIAGALGGGLGGAFGWLLERAGFRVGRWLSILGIALGLGFTQTALFRGLTHELAWNDARTEEALIGTAPEIFSYLKAAFPDDFHQFVRESTSAIRQSSSRGDVERRSAEIMQAMRRKYAPFIRFAPETELSSLIDEQIAFYQLVLLDDAAVCARVAINGPIALAGTDFTERYGTALFPQVLALLHAVRAGIDTPQARRAPNDSDWENIGSEMLAAGASDRDFQAISELDADNLDTCPALLRMLRAINETDTESARVVRASFLSDVSAS